MSQLRPRIRPLYTFSPPPPLARWFWRRKLLHELKLFQYAKTATMLNGMPFQRSMYVCLWLLPVQSMYKAAPDMAFSVKRTSPFMFNIKVRVGTYIFSFKAVSHRYGLQWREGGSMKRGGGGNMYMKAKTKEIFSAYHLGRFDIKYSWFNLQCSMSIYMYIRYVRYTVHVQYKRKSFIKKIPVLYIYVNG